MPILRRPLPIFVQLLAGMFVIAVLVIALTNMFNYRLASQMVLNRSAGYTQESVEQLSAKIDVLLRQYDQFSQLIAFDDRVQKSLNEASDTSPALDPIGLNRYMAEKVRYIANDMLIHLFDRNGNAYASNDSLQLFWRKYDELGSITWFSKVNRLDGRMLWVYGPAWRDGEIPAIIGARKVKNQRDMQVIGDQFVVFPVEKINRIIGETGQRIDRKVQVMDSSGNIVYSTEPREIGTAADQRLFAKFGGSAQPFFEWTTREEQERMYVTFATSSYSGWTTIAYFKPEAVYSDASQIWINALLTIAAGIIVALILVAYFTWSLTKPIRHLASAMNRIGRERILPINERFASREISFLYANYNRMVSQLEEVVERLSEQQTSEQRAQLVALKAQFRPHFLYNSLNLIYWTIEDGRHEAAQEMTIALSELLRYSVHPSSELVTLREDLEQLERYLLLQRSRYGSKFSVQMEIKPGLEEQCVIRLVLQPLVENAFHHGLEHKADGDWQIRVCLYSFDGMLYCTVEDNGKGMDEASLYELDTRIHAEHLLEEKGGGIGLSNLHKQIRAFFGLPYGLKLSPSPLGGLMVTLTLPLHTAGQQVGQPYQQQNVGKGGGGAA